MSLVTKQEIENATATIVDALTGVTEPVVAFIYSGANARVKKLIHKLCGSLNKKFWIQSKEDTVVPQGIAVYVFPVVPESIMKKAHLVIEFTDKELNGFKAMVINNTIGYEGQWFCNVGSDKDAVCFPKMYASKKMRLQEPVGDSSEQTQSMSEKENVERDIREAITKNEITLDHKGVTYKELGSGNSVIAGAWVKDHPWLFTAFCKDGKCYRLELEQVTVCDVFKFAINSVDIMTWGSGVNVYFNYDLYINDNGVESTTNHTPTHVYKYMEGKEMKTEKQWYKDKDVLLIKKADILHPFQTDQYITKDECGRMERKTAYILSQHQPFRNHCCSTPKPVVIATSRIATIIVENTQIISPLLANVCHTTWNPVTVDTLPMLDVISVGYPEHFDVLSCLHFPQGEQKDSYGVIVSQSLERTLHKPDGSDKEGLECAHIVVLAKCVYELLCNEAKKLQDLGEKRIVVGMKNRTYYSDSYKYLRDIIATNNDIPDFCVDFHDLCEGKPHLELTDVSESGSLKIQVKLPSTNKTYTFSIANNAVVVQGGLDYINSREFHDYSKMKLLTFQPETPTEGVNDGTVANSTTEKPVTERLKVIQFFDTARENKLGLEFGSKLILDVLNYVDDSNTDTPFGQLCRDFCNAVVEGKTVIDNSTGHLQSFWVYNNEQSVSLLISAMRLYGALLTLQSETDVHNNPPNLSK